MWLELLLRGSLVGGLVTYRVPKRLVCRRGTDCSRHESKLQARPLWSGAKDSSRIELAKSRSRSKEEHRSVRSYDRPINFRLFATSLHVPN